MAQKYGQFCLANLFTSTALLPITPTHPTSFVRMHHFLIRKFDWFKAAGSIREATVDKVQPCSEQAKWLSCHGHQRKCLSSSGIEGNRTWSYQMSGSVNVCAFLLLFWCALPSVWDTQQMDGVMDRKEQLRPRNCAIPFHGLLTTNVPTDPGDRRSHWWEEIAIDLR